MSFRDVLAGLSLSDSARAIVAGRYLRLLERARDVARRNKAWYKTLSISATVLGVLLTSIISVDKAMSGESLDVIFWITWSISLVVTTATGLLSALAVQKKYILARALREKLESEGWSFVAGIGHYNVVPHERFDVFCTRVEKINLAALDDVDPSELIAMGRESTTHGTRTGEAAGGTVGAPKPASTATRPSSPVSTPATNNVADSRNDENVDSTSNQTDTENSSDTIIRIDELMNMLDDPIIS